MADPYRCRQVQTLALSDSGVSVTSVRNDAPVSNPSFVERLRTKAAGGRETSVPGLGIPEVHLSEL